ncbi:hypothetical protein ACOZ32_00740 (plasmid) [Halobacterium sp. MBLA0001]|uniref:hypothetical protein n=1 Tax=Halobacterium sp. MBLA0001 TaxID=3413511 RepID=UPI003C70D8EF
MNYELPARSAFLELRRGLPVVAAVLFVVALLFPMWIIQMDAVQYPSTTLELHLYAYPRIAGDYAEIANLNKYIGFYYPDPVYWQPNYAPHDYAVDVPEWSFGPLAFVAVSACSAFVALAPNTRKLKRGLLAQLVGTMTVFGVMLADIQYRLYQAGHTLDPDAPVMGVDGFMPPLWGSYEVANITSYSRFGLGAYLSMLAVALLVVALYYRDHPTTVGDLANHVARRLGRHEDPAQTDDPANATSHSESANQDETDVEGTGRA